MVREKQITQFAKGLLKASFDGNGRLSEERVAAVLQALEKNPPSNYVLVLKEYLKFVEFEVAKSTADVEYAGEISQAAIDTIKAKFDEHYGQPISVVTRKNEELIAGLRVRVGCDVYDFSVAGSLKELQASLS